MDTIEKRCAADPDAFARMVADVRVAGTDNLSFFGNGYVLEGGLSLQQNPDEFAALTLLLSEAVRHGPANYLEIGSASGGAAAWLWERTAISEMVSIDDGGHHRYPELKHNFRGLPMTHVKADSHAPATREWLHKLDTTFDVVFIDGDHTEAGVWQDVELCAPVWHPGSLVLFHDIVACEGVKKAWERGAASGLWVPVASYVGAERPLGIGVGFCL